MFGVSLRRSEVLKVHEALLEPVMEIFISERTRMLTLEADYFDFGNDDDTD